MQNRTNWRRTAAEVDLSKWNIRNLIAACQAALDEFSKDPEAFDIDGSDNLSYFLETISSGAAGIYQAQEIASFFDLEDVNFGEELDEGEEHDEDSAYEYFWDEIDQYIDPIARALSAELDKAGLPGHIYFGHLEGDGSYGMFYSVDMRDFEAYEEEAEEARLTEEELDARDLNDPNYAAPPSTDPRQTTLRLEGSTRRAAYDSEYSGIIDEGDEEELSIEELREEINEGLIIDQDGDDLIALYEGKEVVRADVNKESVFWHRVRRWMKQEGYFPNIYSVNDHGNVTQYDNKGNAVNSWV
jgi:hypothetical protein